MRSIDVLEDEDVDVLRNVDDKKSSVFEDKVINVLEDVEDK